MRYRGEPDAPAPCFRVARSPEWWAARVKPGRIMFELDGVPRDVAREAFVLAAAKLPVRTRFIVRLGEES